MPPLLTGLLEFAVGALSNVRVSCLLSRAALTPPEVTGLVELAVGVESNVNSSCLLAKAV